MISSERHAGYDNASSGKENGSIGRKFIRLKRAALLWLSQSRIVFPPTPMKYVPNLIPEHSSPGTDTYERGSLNKRAAEAAPAFLRIIGISFAILTFIISLPTLFTNVWAGIILILLGLAFLPGGYAVLERRFKFSFSWPVRLVCIPVLFILFAIVISNDTELQAERNKKTAEEQAAKALAEKEKEAVTALAIKKEQIRKARVEGFRTKAQARFKGNSAKAGLVFLDSAIIFATTERNELIETRAAYYFKTGKFEAAMKDYTSLLDSTNRNDIYYQRARCYVKLKQIKSAVADLQSAMDKGNTEASVLYEKINPLKRRVLYYVTRCCDGSTSNAKGRGACSHHDGVCDWNDPVYETYREY